MITKNRLFPREVNIQGDMSDNDFFKTNDFAHVFTKIVCLRVKWILRELWAKNVLKKDENDFCI